jgi:hypothetical protein
MKALALSFWIILGVAGLAPGQARGTSECLLSGAYRIDVQASDRLYSVVQGATSSVPFRDQQRFFMDLSTRLTPPDMLAIECSGKRVSLASSRAPRTSFLADGITRSEKTASGSIIQSRVVLRPDVLTFTSNGRAEDRINVVFQSIDDGRQMRVTRRIYADQLAQPIVIQSVYNKISDVVSWEGFGESQVASQVVRRTENSNDRNGGKTSNEAEVLRSALNAWIDATNRRNIDRQMTYYSPVLKAYYLTRNTPKSRVRKEKNRAFSMARSIDIRIQDPEIVFLDNGLTAVMRFRKQYRIVNSGQTKSGEVIQELRWQRIGAGWKIFSERDVRVLR